MGGLFRETLKISSKNDFLPILEQIYYKISKTIVRDLCTYFVLKKLWLIKSENNFLILKTHEEVNFLRQNITLFLSSFLIGRPINDIQVYFSILDFGSNIQLY
jgi:hypothetical protein